MELLRLITLLLAAATCSADIRGRPKYAEVYEVEVDEDHRALKGASGFKGGTSFRNNDKGKKGGGMGKTIYAPAGSPVIAPAAGCNTPACMVPTVTAPTPCGAGGCGNPTMCTGRGCGSPGKGNAGKGVGKGSGGGKKGGIFGKKGGSSLGGKKGGYGKGTPSCPGGNCPPNNNNTGCGCRIDQVELDFVMLPPNATVPVAPNLPASTIGTVFIYNDALFDLNLTALPGTFIAGLCHRTQLTQNAGGDNTLVGGGYCHFTFTVSDGTTSVTFNAAGEVFDVLGGTLALTGGTGELTGTYGEVEIVPVYETEAQIDFFTQASLYVGSASLFVPLF